MADQSRLTPKDKKALLQVDAFGKCNDESLLVDLLARGLIEAHVWIGYGLTEEGISAVLGKRNP